MDKPERLYPVTSELLRRAFSNDPIELETVDLGDLWLCDTVPVQQVRMQLLQLLKTRAFDPVTKNNLITLCSFYLFWKEPAAQGLKVIDSLVGEVDFSDRRGALSFFGLRAKAQAESGDLPAALESLQQAIMLIGEQHQLIDLWGFITRLTVICRRAGEMQDALIFSQINYLISASMQRALPLGRSRFGLAYSFIGVGYADKGKEILQPQLDGLLAGTDWIEAANLPLVPLLLATGMMQHNDLTTVPRMIALSADMQVRGYEQYSDSSQFLVTADYLQCSGDLSAAQTPLMDTVNALVQLRDMDLYASRRALKIHSNLNVKNASPSIKKLQELVADLAPERAQWRLIIPKVKAALLHCPCLQRLPSLQFL